MDLPDAQSRQFLERAARIAREAGRIILSHGAAGQVARHKHDASPVTDADIAADIHIVAALKELAPAIPVISEEQESLPEIGASKLFWLVDPLDGTRSFVKGRGDYTVNIALVTPERPLLGVIYVPVRDAMYSGAAGLGAWKAEGKGVSAPIACRKSPAGGLDAVKSHSHASPRTDAFLAALPVRAQTAAASSLKFCLVAEGTADVYPRFDPTMEWDTAAGHAILNAAGGRVETPDGAPLRYGKPGFRNPDFVAWGK